ncbi:hypothetical protein [Alicyclobacillus dauci]|uniref:Lipoprotein n=1 Tax=Alicyclobacillus dauci TaxID=1475485 RepID=A0ABY6Z1A3_9BACL|nr:hypothetical protein [Alicyclobacillus dauci]WAH36504.1 hypothetical protein NZD86_20210 [Alicyclobacillus dauci]
MKTQATTVGAVMCALLLVTACGATSQTSFTPSANTTTNGQSSPGNSSNSTNHSNHTNTNDTTASSQSETPIKLVPFSDATSSGIQVQVPANWTQTPVRGGDYSGWKFTNPSDPNQVEVVVSSTCVGCYMGSNGKPDPTKVVPQGDENVHVSPRTDNAITYQFTKSGNPYQGRGALITSTDNAGYAYVETLFAKGRTDASQNVIAGFQFHR